jgi:hypothetical protein
MRPPERARMTTIQAVVAAANGLAETLLLVLDRNASKSARRSARYSAGHYLEWFRRSGITVMFTDGAGRHLKTRPGKYPQTIGYIALRSSYVLTRLGLLYGRGHPGLRIEEMSPLGQMGLVVPLYEPDLVYQQRLERTPRRKRRRSITEG